MLKYNRTKEEKIREEVITLAMKEEEIKTAQKNIKEEIEKKYEVNQEPEQENDSNPTFVESYHKPKISVCYDYKIDVYSRIFDLLTLSDRKTMLFLFGFFIANNSPELIDNKYHYSLCLNTKDEKQAKSLCDLLYRLVFNDDKHPSAVYDSSAKIKNYFKACDYYLPLILTDADFNKSDRKKFSDVINHYYEHKPKKLKEAVIIVSEKEIACKYIHNICLSINDTPETEKTLIALKSNTTIYETLKMFFKYEKNINRNGYIDDYENDYEVIKSELTKRKKNLARNHALTNDEAIIYAPVIYFLEQYFEFLHQSQAITKEEYDSLSNIVMELYCNTCAEEAINNSEESQQPTVEEISDTLLQCIFEAHKKGLLPENTTDEDAYFYTGSKTEYNLICFAHDEDSPMKYVIDYLEKIGMGEKISDIKEYALTNGCGTALKKYWKEKELSHCSKGDNLLYGTKTRKVIAIIC